MDEFFDIGLIDGSPQTLPIGAVLPAVALQRGAFVESQIITVKGLQNLLLPILHLSLRIRVLNAQIENAAALVSQTFTDDGAEQVA